ncbi:anhydro-N-acetylmuramic acid kinase [Candidatus Xenohaliotis californiensis]|uniref:Anhydro-N-acetylmuramic acid kinase n=2 Tax=Candidatus Xenohaliotis californiensis TaxID=84677 RepID=A0ABP0ETJ5_9RICK|nr:anhydro-N-acetylmuramic acid kinase [Candidatus Xenohaliotis californiensis]
MIVDDLHNMQDKHKHIEFNKSYLAIGLMSGTSADGVDVSLIETNGLHDIKVVKDGFMPYPKHLQKKINHLMSGFGDQWSIARELTIKHIEAVKHLFSPDELHSAEIVGFHGQTIHHEPELMFTLQIGDPYLLAYHLQTPVVFNFRERDILYGGQGAPLVPIYHQNFLSGLIGIGTGIVNIGGISNITIVAESEERMMAGDVGPGCCIIDCILNDRKLPLTTTSNMGNINSAVSDIVLQDSFFQMPIPKSLDKNYFYKYMKNFYNLSSEDALTTAAFCTVKPILDMLDSCNLSKLLILGGGCQNYLITSLLKNFSKNIDIVNADNLDINSNNIESQAFAYLAVRSIKGLPISYPNCTGVIKPLSGGVFYQF